MEYWLTIWIFAIVTSITPGPNNIMIMTSGLNFGIKRSLPHLFGICCGFPAMLIVIGLGLSTLFQQYPFLHQVIQITGAFYLLYLAWLMANSASSSLESAVAKPISFIQAALFQWLNPKAWVIATGAISTFTTLSVSLHWQVLYLSLVFFIIAIPCMAVWLLGGIQMKKYLAKPSHQRYFNVLMALLLVGSIIPVFYGLGLALTS